MNVLIKNNNKIAYQSYGNSQDKVVFICHGLVSSRIEAKLISNLLGEGFLVVGIDRPGMGYSSFNKDRNILNFVDDLISVADELSIDSFSVLGTSAGAAYALACAYKIPHRISSLHIVSGLAPLSKVTQKISKEMRLLQLLTTRVKWLIKPIFWLSLGRLANKIEQKDKFLLNMMQSLSDTDKELINNLTIKDYFWEACVEAYRYGSQGVAYDAILAYGNDWGFSLKDITLNNIYCYHGEKDLGAPISMGKYICKAVNGKLYRYAEDGHLSTIINQIEQIKKNIKS
jgi:pimeloyl-ACP methyl ester carboxylesterase